MFVLNRRSSLIFAFGLRPFFELTSKKLAQDTTNGYCYMQL